MQPLIQQFIGIALGAMIYGLTPPIQAAPVASDPHFIASPAELQRRIQQELRVTKPDFVVFVPRVTDTGMNDTGNEHFLVFEGPDGSLMAVWTQSSAESQPDQHIAFSRSADQGRTWSPARTIAGPRKPGDGHMASWGYPLVSQSGRIYVLYSQHIGKHDNFVHHTGWLHGIYSDDNGQTWSKPRNVPVARSLRDNPDTNMPPNMLCWQKPLRLGEDGKYFAGFTRWTSFAVQPNPTPSWISADSRVEFMRFENLDDNPEVKDLKIRWFAANEQALAVPFPGHPEVSACQEPSVVKLPDGRLFCVMRTAAGSPYWSVSADRGETWTQPRRLLRQDGGEALLHPLSPCPIYDVGGNTAGSGRYVLFIHNHDGHYQGFGPTDTGFHRRPIYLVSGHFQTGADQPVWFDTPRLFMDHQGVSLGKPGTRGRLDLALYSSFTVRQGRPVLWYPERKFFLLGKVVTEDWLSGGALLKGPPATPSQSLISSAPRQTVALADDLPPAKPAVVTRTNVFVSGIGGYHTYRIPALLATAQGTLLAFTEGRKGSSGDAGDIDLLLRRSTDQGRTWQDTQLIWDDGSNTCGNPCPVLDRDTGTIWLLLTWNRGEDREPNIIAQHSKDTRRVFVTSSTDDGVTWSKPSEITASVKPTNWTWYATGPGAGIQIEYGLSRGRLVIPCDHIEAGTRRYYSHVIFSDDHGKSWNLGGSTPRDRVNECEVVELVGGRLLLNMRNYDPTQRTRQQAVSHDGGLAWVDQRHVPELVEPICQASIRRVSWPGAHRRSIILFSNPASTRRERLTVRASLDEGQTWPVSRLLDPRPSAYSCLAVLPDNIIGILYETGDQNPYQTMVFARFPVSWLLDDRP